MKIENLIPTHNELRSPDKLWEKYIWDNGENKDKKKPVVINTCDKKNYIQDGHHRLVIYYWLGHLQLALNEYKSVKYSAKEYEEINFEESWVTPFKIHSEVRVPDFGMFKTLAMRLKSEDFIRKNKWTYARYRYTATLEKLADKYAPEVYVTDCPFTPAEKALGLPQSPAYAYVRLAHTNFVIGGACKHNGRIVESYLSKWHGSTQTELDKATNIVRYL